MSTDSKKAAVTEENRAESAALKKIWIDRKTSHRLNLSQAEFGDKFGIGTQGTVTHCLNGTMAISLKAATGFALGLRCQVADFSPRLAAKVNAVNQATVDALLPNTPTPGLPVVAQEPALKPVNSPPPWPFEMFTYHDWMTLTKKDRQDYEALIFGAVHRAQKTRRSA